MPVKLLENCVSRGCYYQQNVQLKPTAGCRKSTFHTCHFHVILSVCLMFIKKSSLQVWVSTLFNGLAQSYLWHFRTAVCYYFYTDIKLTVISWNRPLILAITMWQWCSTVEYKAAFKAAQTDIFILTIDQTTCDVKEFYWLSDHCFGFTAHKCTWFTL